MLSERSFRSPLRFVASALAVISFCCTLGFAQDDPDPNSPTPVFISMEGTPRAFAYTALRSRKYTFAKPSVEAFRPNSRIVLFVTNVALMEDEGAGAFRVYAEDGNGRTYRFPVLDLSSVADRPGVYAITTVLRDEIGFWPRPEPNGDLKLYIAWRGLASNSLKLGFGRTGGKFENDKSLRPSPITNSSISVDSIANKGDEPVDELVKFGPKWSGDRMRFLEQAAFGPTPELDFHVRRIGLRSWLAEQFQETYPTVSNPFPNQPLKPSTAPADCDNDQTVTPDIPATCYRDTYTQYQPQTWFFREAFYGKAQLRHRVAWALSQIWVTSGVEIQQGRHMTEYYKILANNAFGNYRQLMGEMTLNPTMGDYLDMAGSTRSNPNENYPRELMQLFTVGLFLLNQDGTYQRDAQNNPIPTYDQSRVNELTRVFTGWNYCHTTARCPNYTSGTPNFIDPMLLNVGVTQVSSNRHDLNAKVLLSYPGSTTTNVPACSNCTTLANIETYANNSLEQALDNIFYHPNLAPQVCRTLIQQLVTSDPTPAYIARVSAAFNNNGYGVRGDMKAVIRAILLDPEARGDAKTDPNFGKLREPVLFATNFARQFGVRSGNGTGLSDGYMTGRPEFTGMGQSPLRSPSVFNYYPPTYVVPKTAMLGPEFALMNTGTSVQRLNFINRMVFTTIPIGVGTDAPNGTSFNFGEYQAASDADPTGNRLMDLLNTRMLHGTMAPAMRETVRNAVVANIPATNGLGRVRQAIYLVATSSQYQVQR